MTPSDRAHHALPLHPKLQPVVAQAIYAAQVAAIRHVINELALDATNNGKGRTPEDQAAAIRYVGAGAFPEPVEALA